MCRDQKSPYRCLASARFPFARSRTVLVSLCYPSSRDRRGGVTNLSRVIPANAGDEIRVHDTSEVLVPR